MSGWHLANPAQFWGGAHPGPWTDRNGALIEGNFNVWTGTNSSGNRYPGYTLGTEYPIAGMTNMYYDWMAKSYHHKSTGMRLFAMSEPLRVLGPGQAVPARWYTGLPASQSNVPGQIGGGATTPGGVSFVLDQVGAGSASFWGQSSEVASTQLSSVLGATAASLINFTISPTAALAWQLNFTGNVIGGGQLTFGYSESSLSGLDESALRIYHYTTANGWKPLSVLSRNPTANTITVRTDGFSPFMLGGPVPEPATYLMLLPAAVGAVALKRRWRRR
jgi:hypothetical protein